MFDPNTPLTNQDLPLVQTFDLSWAWPIEFVGIWQGYPDYTGYIQTGGTTNTDWNDEANTDSQYIWEGQLLQDDGYFGQNHLF